MNLDTIKREAREEFDKVLPCAQEGCDNNGTFPTPSAGGGADPNPCPNCHQSRLPFKEFLDTFADRLLEEVEKAVVPEEVVYNPNGDHTTCSNSINRTEGWNKCRERVQRALTRFKGENHA